MKIASIQNLIQGNDDDPGESDEWQSDDPAPHVSAQPSTSEALADAEGEAPADAERGPVKNDYVVVEYHGKCYPGLMLTHFDDSREACISCMRKKGKFWEWPNSQDVLWYKERQIKKKIAPPIEISRNKYQVDW